MIDFIASIPAWFLIILLAIGLLMGLFIEDGPLKWIGWVLVVITVILSFLPVRSTVWGFFITHLLPISIIIAALLIHNGFMTVARAIMVLATVSRKAVVVRAGD